MKVEKQALRGPARPGGQYGWRTSQPLAAVAIGVAEVAALQGTGSQILVPPVVFALLWALATLTVRVRGGSIDGEGYAVAVVTVTAFTLFMLPSAMMVGPITTMAIVLLLLAVRGRNPSLGVAAATLLIVPLDSRGAIALFSEEGNRFVTQLVAAAALLLAAAMAYAREPSLPVDNETPQG